MAAKKKFGRNEIVLKVEVTTKVKGEETVEKLDVSPLTMGILNLKGAKIVSGEAYYVEKAIKAGAVKAGE